MDPSRTYVSPSVIATLQDRVRTSAWRRMLAGHYGPIVRRGYRDTPYVLLAKVEDFHGVTFTVPQLEAAVAGRPDHILTVPVSEPEPVEAV